jgi:hypothetical protein
VEPETNGVGNAISGDSNPVYQTALAHLRAGDSIIPIRRDGSKAPQTNLLPRVWVQHQGKEVPTWSPFKECIVDEATARLWWGRKCPPGIAAVNGQVSGNRESLDFDRDAATIFPAWSDLVEAECPSLIARLCVVRTPRQPAGYHVHYRISGMAVPGNQKLARLPAHEEPDPKKRVLIETRGEGGYILLPGSPAPCHDTGGTYEHVAGPAPTALATITAEEREILLRCARTFDREAQEEPRPRSQTGMDLRPGDEYDLHGPDWSDLLIPCGWTLWRQVGEVRYWTRPGKARGVSATTGYCRRHRDGADLLKVFTSSAAPLEPDKPYSRFQFFALMNTGGDWSSAAGMLRHQGFGGSPSPASPGSPGSPYTIEAGRICRRSYSRGGEECAQPLCNFVARIVEEVCLDDGSGEPQHIFAIEGTLQDGASLPRTQVRSSEFASMAWPVTSWGVRAIVFAGQGCKDHLRAAIQEQSVAARRKTVYKHTGWRLVGDQWLYLHGAGAIGPAGLSADLAVDLDGSLAGFRLPSPPVEAALVQAVRASLGLLELGPPGILAPLLGATYRSVLGPADFGVHLVGQTGAGKSELAALAQQHFGSGMGRLGLPGAWSSTANALEVLCFTAKDALVVIDDFKPGGPRSQVDAWHALADRIFRALGNNGARQRCTSDARLRPPRPPRGLILSTGEDSPRGESLLARLYTVHIRKGDICLARLTPYQQQAARGVYSQALAGFLRWLAGRYDTVRGELPERHARLRDEVHAAGQHPRTPGAIANLLLGWAFFLDFAQDVEAIAQKERDAMLAQVKQSLFAGARDQAADIAAQDPAQRFLSLVWAAISSGKAHLAGPGEPPLPSSPLAWGWTGDADHYTPRGQLVGWVEEDNVFLEPETAFALAQQIADDQGERLTVTKGRLQRSLKEKGLLATTEQDKTTNRFILQGQRRAVLHLRARDLISGEQGEQGDQG